MTVDFGLTIFILISIAGLGLLVYFKDPKNKTNRLFGILTFWMVIWITSNFLENESIGPKLTTLFLKIDFASASLLVYFWFLFCLNFPQPYEISSKIKKILIFAPAIIFAILSFILSFSDLIIYNIRFYEKAIHFDLGNLYPLYGAYIWGYMIVGGCGNLVLKYRKAKGLQKVQILYVLLGFSISALIAGIINLFFQRILPVELFRMGIYGIIFLVGFTTYAIIKHHLMNIKVILTDFLVGIMGVILLMLPFLMPNNLLRILTGAVFLLFCIFGYYLIKTTYAEAKRKEEAEEMAFHERFQKEGLLWMTKELKERIEELEKKLKGITENTK